MLTMFIERAVQTHMRQHLFQGKVLVVYGPRQSGKTTLMRHIITLYPEKRIKYVSGDDYSIAQALTNASSSTLKTFVDGVDILVIDEAQYIHNIGLTLKLLHDTYPRVQVIATGSSSFELANKVIEPLTGRNYEFYILPFSLGELKDASLYQGGLEQELETRILYGMYPEIVLSDSATQLKLEKIASDYTSKDVLRFDRIRKSDKLIALLKALALQIGNEFSDTEIGQTIGIDKETVYRYLDILEQSFIIFRLNPYTTNSRRALRRLKKVYFWDTGLRNALIQNFNPLDLRTDKGGLFENFCIAELLKKQKNTLDTSLNTFWRSYGGEEIDFLVEKNGHLTGYECKWKHDKDTIQKSASAPVREVKVITRYNVLSFL